MVLRDGSGIVVFKTGHLGADNKADLLHGFTVTVVEAVTIGEGVFVQAVRIS